jgi:predicted ATPase
LDYHLTVLKADQFVVVSGCSGGGKSTLLSELGRRGYAIVEEPGRRIVRQELEAGGSALPWFDGIAFARRAVVMALDDRARAEKERGWVFFDRGLIDAAVALEHLTGEPVLQSMNKHRYHNRVFLMPPWEDIYGMDSERRHSFNEAVAEYERLTAAYCSLRYEIVLLPKASVTERAEVILRNVDGDRSLK